MQRKIPYLERQSGSEVLFRENVQFITSLEDNGPTSKDADSCDNAAREGYLRYVSQKYNCRAFFSGVAALGTSIYSREISRGFIEDRQTYLNLSRRCVALAIEKKVVRTAPSLKAA